MKTIVKTIATAAAVLTAIFVLAGSARSTTLHLHVDGIDHGYVQSVSRGIVSCSNTGSDSLSVVLRGEGDYQLDLRDGRGYRYPVTLRYHDGKAETAAPDGVTVTVR